MKLEDIPKQKDLFAAPSGYFEALPQKIQAKTTARPPKQLWAMAWGEWKLKYALPVLSLVLALVLFKWGGGPVQAPTLSDVPDEQIRQYLLQHHELDEKQLIEQGAQLDWADLPLDLSADEIEQELTLEELEYYTK